MPILKKLFYFSAALLFIVGAVKFYQNLQKKEVVLKPVESNPSSSPTPIPVRESPVKEINAGGIKKETVSEDSKESKEMSNLNMKEMEELDHSVEAVEEAWLEESRKMFIEELHLTDEQYEEYLTMRKGYEEDRYEAYQKFHEKQLKEKGSYPITNEDDANEGVLKEYQDLFKNRFGDKAAATYMKALDSFNSALSQDRGQDATVLKVDF